LSLLLIKPFFGSILSALVASFIFYPIYKKVNNKVNNEDISILIVVFFLIFLILTPIILILYSLIDDIENLIVYLKGFDLGLLSFLENYFIKSSEKLASSIFTEFSDFVSKIPDKFFSFIIFIFLFYNFLKNGPKIIEDLKITIPIKKEYKEILIKDFKIVAKTVIYSNIFSSFLNGLTLFLVFIIFRIPNPLLWGFSGFLFSFIPVINSSPIWIGGALYLIFKKISYVNIILFAILGITTIQIINIITLKMFGKFSRINSLLLLIGIIGGMKNFGFIGIFLGPFILLTLITLFKSYRNNIREIRNKDG